MVIKTLLKEHHLSLAASITLGCVLHRVGRLSRGVRDGASMREEQNLDRDGKAGMQSNDDDEEDARWLCVDG